jgi:hypothetical protein
MNDDGKPFWLIAVLVIAFVNWVSTKLKERQEEKNAQREREEYIRSKAGQHVDNDVRQFEPSTKSLEPEETSIDIHDFFAQFSGKAVTPPAIPPKRAPITTVDIPVPRVISKETKSAAALFESHTKKKTRKKGSSVKSLLRTPGSVRQAFVLKEILDKPKGLEPL